MRAAHGRRWAALSTLAEGQGENEEYCRSLLEASAADVTLEDGKFFVSGRHKNRSRSTRLH